MALLFYIASERILYHLPSIAPMVTIADLVAQPEDYAGKWVRIRAEIWRRSGDEAILVPPGSGPEPLGIKTNAEVLPKAHLYTHNFKSDGITSVSVEDLPADQAVTVVGEFEAATATFVLHIDAAAIIDPPQIQHSPAMNRRLSLHLVWLGTSGMAAVTGFGLLVSAWRRVRSSQSAR